MAPIVENFSVYRTKTFNPHTSLGFVADSHIEYCKAAKIKEAPYQWGDEVKIDLPQNKH